MQASLIEQFVVWFWTTLGIPALGMALVVIAGFWRGVIYLRRGDGVYRSTAKSRLTKLGLIGTSIIPACVAYCVLVVLKEMAR